MFDVHGSQFPMLFQIPQIFVNIKTIHNFFLLLSLSLSLLAGRSLSVCLFLICNSKEYVEQGITASVQDESKRDALMAKVLDRAAMEKTAVYASSRVLDDGVILPQDTRQVMLCQHL